MLMWIITIVILYVTYCIFLSRVITFWRNTSTWGSPILTETSNVNTYVSTKWREGIHTVGIQSAAFNSYFWWGISNVYYTGQSHMLSSNVTNGHYMNQDISLGFDAGTTSKFLSAYCCLQKVTSSLKIW